MLWINGLYFILSALVLVVSGGLLVKSLSKISRFLRISEFSAAFIIMALATSIPEMFVGISSALAGNPQLSLGNIIGANILDFTLIVGVVVLISKNINLKGKDVDKDIYLMMIAVTLVLVLYIIGNSLSRIDGIILVLFFIINVFYRLKRRGKYSKKYKKNHIKRISVVLNVFVFTLALILLFFSSKYLVEYASLLAIDFNLPQIVVGLFLLSIATTLPELVFGISASKMEHKGMSIGNLTGTILANSTLVLGLVAIISPIQAEFLPFLVSGLFMFICGFIFIAFAKSGKKLETIEGVGLILLYVLFVSIELFIK